MSEITEIYPTKEEFRLAKFTLTKFSDHISCESGDIKYLYITRQDHAIVTTLSSLGHNHCGGEDLLNIHVISQHHGTQEPCEFIVRSFLK